MLRRLTLLLVCTLAACKGGDPPPDPGKAALALEEAPAFSKASAILATLPAETVGVALAADPGDVLSRLGREAVIKAIPELYNQAATEIREEVGFDLLDPARWTEIGVDPHGPAGFFFVATPFAGGAVATLSDPAKLTAFIQKMGAGHLTVQAVGDAKLLVAPHGDPTFVIRGNQAFLVVGRGLWSRAWGAHIATLKADQAIQADPDFTAAQAALKYGRDASGFLHVPRLVDAVIDDMTGRIDNTRLDRFIEAATQRGDTELAGSLTEERREPSRGSGREQMMMGALKSVLFGGLGPLVAGARIEDDAVRLRMKMALSEGALPRRLLAAGAGINPIATLAGPDFMFLLGGRVNAEACVAVLRSVALAVGEGDDFEREVGMVREQLGISLEDDVIKALSGEVGFALLDQDPKIEGEQRLGVTGFAGVADEKKLKATFDKLARHPELSQLFVPTAEGFSIKNEWKPLSAVLGPRLLITTDPAAVKRLPGDGNAESLSPALAAILRMDGASAVGAIDIGLTMALTLLVRFDWEPPAPSTQNRTPEIEAKLKEWEAMQAQIKKASDDRQAREMAAIQRMTRPLGHFALAARLTPEGLEIEGGQFFRGSTVSQAFANLATEAAAMDKASDEAWKQSEELHRKLGEIRNEIERLDSAMLPVPVPVPGDVPPPGEAPPAELKLAVPPDAPQQLPPDDGKME
jgi:hypothetical protein